MAMGDMRAVFRWPAVAVIVAGAVLAHVAVNGYSFGGCTERLLVTSSSSDHANILPWVHWYQDRSLYAHDFEIQMGASYATVLWPIVAQVARVAPLEWTFFLLHVLSLAATYLLLFLLARELSGSDWAGIAACALFIVPRDGPAGEATHDSALYTRGVAMPMALLCLWLILKGRGGAGFAVLAVTVAVHSLTAFYVAPVAAGMWLLDSRVDWLRRLLTLAGGAAACGIVAWLVGGGQGMNLGAPSPEWLALQRGNNVMHVFPSAWSETVWHDLAACAAFLLAALLGDPARVRRVAIAACVAAVLLAALGWVTAEWRPSMLFMQLQPFRGLKFTMVVGLLCAAWAICEMPARGGKLAAIAGCVCFAGLVGRMDKLAVIGCLVLLAAMWRMVAGRRVFLALAMAACAGVIAWLEAAGLRTSSAAGLTHSLIVAAAAIGIGVLPRRVRPIGLAVLAGVFLSISPWQHDRKSAIAYANDADFPFLSKNDAWIDVQRWIDGHTAKDAFFITPPILEGFRTYSRRSEFADWKQGTLSMFNERFGIEWSRRLRLLMTRQMDRHEGRNLELNYDAMTADELAALAQQYGLTHAVVMHRRSMFPLEELYSNDAFRVLKLR